MEQICLHGFLGILGTCTEAFHKAATYRFRHEHHFQKVINDGHFPRSGAGISKKHRSRDLKLPKFYPKYPKKEKRTEPTLWTFWLLGLGRAKQVTVIQAVKDRSL
jgi:hypothetical protein